MRLLDNPYAEQVAVALADVAENAVFARGDVYLSNNARLQRDGVALLVLLWALIVLEKRERQMSRAAVSDDGQHDMFGAAKPTPRTDAAAQAAPDFVGVSKPTVKLSRSMLGSVRHWRVVENRTSFERVARTYGAEDAVVWVPGFAPHWWLEAVASMLILAPAEALIACDPDPSGIEIALAVGKVWETARLTWTPWRMSAAALQSLPSRRPLSVFDRTRLESLRRRSLPADLEQLADWMARHDQKGSRKACSDNPSRVEIVSNLFFVTHWRSS